MDLAAGLAELGHEVHVITTETEQDRVDFEDGVWVHRLVTRNLDLPQLGAAPAAFNLYRAATVAAELDRIHGRSPIDLVSAPLWASEGCVSHARRPLPDDPHADDVDAHDRGASPLLGRRPAGRGADRARARDREAQRLPARALGGGARGRSQGV